MEFTVIDAHVIRSNHDDRGGKTDAEDPDEMIAWFKELRHLDLSCSNILHIANLGLISSTNLTSLKLSVNRIDKICNLETYTNLLELDLSHNHIKQIENLQGLVKLRRLVLNHNPLTTVQNLDSQLDSLEMLDIGYCKITSIRFIFYLKKFKNLVSLIVEGNPFRIVPADSERKFIISLVQSLLVYNNKTVTVEEKKESLETFSKLISLLENNDKKLKRLSEDEKLRLERMNARKDAFLDRIPESGDVDFNVSIFRNPTVEQVLNENSRYGIHNAYRVHAENFRQLINEITEAAETSRETRTRLVIEFREKLRCLINDGVNESRKCVTKFAEYKKRLKCDLHKSGDSLQDDTVATDETQLVMQREAAKHKRLDKRTRVLWLVLMGHEDSLFRKITEMIAVLQDVLEKHIMEFKQLVNNRFGVLQRQQNVFLQFVLEYAVCSAQSDDVSIRFHKIVC
ncbi:dynein regulatory complex subunit 3-like isoform X2 [Sipha flava]|uniref:Dynein axonemal assembly factor 1 homolog n=1 Tax=Sipha flava TaxID=143950 RepID=A0A8B8FDX8_9HEMI|nr:dynein regulatory complex subunit 3-like isoform X2 [Sipha flava]